MAIVSPNNYTIGTAMGYVVDGISDQRGGATKIDHIGYKTKIMCLVGGGVGGGAEGGMGVKAG